MTMIIKRDYYLQQLISSKSNNLIKIVTGIRRSGILHIHSRKLTQMTKIGNMFNVLVLFNENEHGCNNEQT